MVVNIAFDPIITRIGSFELGWHGIFTALAVVVAVWLGVRRGERLGMPLDPLTSVAIWGVFGGVVGARLFHLLDHLPYYLANPLQALSVWEGGVAAYGGFIGGVVGGLIAAKRTGLRLWPVLDAGGPAILVGQAIGRLGCFSNGDAWGAPTGADWGVVYSHPHALLPAGLLGVPTHPYPLYEIAACLVLLGVLWLGRSPLGAPGQTFLVAALGYAAIRFGLTFFRQETVLFWGLQEAQVIALATGLIALVLLAARARLGPGARASGPVAPSASS